MVDCTPPITRMVALVALTLGALACSEEDAREGGSREDSVEYKLAVVDKGGFVAPDDPVVDDLARALDSLDPKCNEPRSRLGDMAVVAQKELPRLSLLRILQGVNASIPEDFGSQPCADIFALYVTQQR